MVNKAAINLTRIGRTTGPDQEELLILRDKRKKNIDYEDTSETNRMRRELHVINNKLCSHWIDLYITDAEFETLGERMFKADTKPQANVVRGVDFSRRQLVRIFNNGAWNQGGRFYGTWWHHIPSEFRRHIRIDDKPTVEVDYSGLHVEMLYAEVGEALDGDAYTIPDVPRQYRSTIKVAWNMLINAKGVPDQPDKYEADAIGISWRELLDRIASRHEPIKDFFKSGKGIELQRRDADIAARVMLRMCEMSYPCLPVHDSFIVHHALAEELEDIMVEEFRRDYGRAIPIKFKAGGDETSPSAPPKDGDAGSFLDVSLDQIFASEEQYSQYHDRLNNWRSDHSTL